MKLERLPEYATAAITISIGMLLAVYIGVSAGAGSKSPMFIIGGGIAVGLALLLKKNIWLLIPICSPLALPTLGTNFGISHFVVFYAFAVFLTLRALKIARGKATNDWLDYLLFINLAYLAMTYIRNPVGTLSLGFEKVGGRPYIEVVFALLTYYVFRHVTISPVVAMRLPFLMVFGNLFNTFAGIIGTFFPSIGLPLYRIYGAFAPNLNTASDIPGQVDLNRQSFYIPGSVSSFNTLCSYFSPLSLVNPIHLFRFVITSLAIIGMLRSGFRNIFFSSLLFFFFAAYFRNGIIAAIRIPIVMASILVLAIVGQGTLFNLPLNVQRTLSFLPGHWNYTAKHDAEASTRWRHEIWANVWNSGDKYIKDWWLGDGFGITKVQFREAVSIKDAQENLTISGAYHSLPLSTIHIVGYVGLFLFVIELGGIAIYAWKLVKRAKHTPYFPLTLLIAMPNVYTGVTGMIVFGAFDQFASDTVIVVAWMRLISRSLDHYLEQKKQDEVKQRTVMPDLDLAPQFQRPLLKNPL